MAYKRHKKSSDKQSIYQIITDRIIQLLQQNIVPWRRTWLEQNHPGLAFDINSPRSLATNKLYSGINAMLLSAIMLTEAYESPYFVTWLEAKKRGASIRKDSKGYPVIFWQFKMVEDKSKGIDTQSSKNQTKVIPFLRQHTVFNAAQCVNLEVPKLEIPKPLDLEGKAFDPIETAERIWQNMPETPHLRHENQKAYYHPGQDFINMPLPESFNSPEDYYSVRFHETVHWTGHEKRLNRETLTAHTIFGSKTYGREELVAEMGAAMLCAQAGISNQTIENSVAYLQSWMQAIKEDPKMLITCASQAQQAAAYILNESTEDMEPQIDVEEFADSEAETDKTSISA